MQACVNLQLSVQRSSHQLSLGLLSTFRARISTLSHHFIGTRADIAPPSLLPSAKGPFCFFDVSTNNCCVLCQLSHGDQRPCVVYSNEPSHDPIFFLNFQPVPARQSPASFPFVKFLMSFSMHKSHCHTCSRVKCRMWICSEILVLTWMYFSSHRPLHLSLTLYNQNLSFGQKITDSADHTQEK